MDPVRIGTVRDTVVEISLDRDGLEWLAYQCPEGDGFTDDLFDALRQVEEREALEAEGPGLAIVLRPDGPTFAVTRL